jgi:hypothetical protein
MISAIFISLALVAGWLIAVSIAITVTMAIGAAMPGFVVTDYHTIRFRFKALETLVWMLCAATGSFAAAWVVGGFHPYVGAALLAVMMIAVQWRNSWEARQRGLAMQILMTVALVAGVVIGFAVEASLKLPGPY